MPRRPAGGRSERGTPPAAALDGACAPPVSTRPSGLWSIPKGSGMRAKRSGSWSGGSSGSAAHAVQQASSAVARAARQLEPVAQSAARSGADALGPYLASSADRTAQILSKVGEHLSE